MRFVVTRCVHGRYVWVGRFVRRLVAGRNSVTFTGRIAGRTLRPGSYRLTLVATDAAGNTDNSHRALHSRRRSFKIVRG